MECRECGLKIKEDAAFCGVCGTKVEEAPKTCTGCGEIVNENAKFCRKCGQSTKEIGVEEIEEEIIIEDEVVVTQLIEEEVATTAVEIVEQAEEQPTQPAPKGNKNKNIILSVVIGVALILLIMKFGGTAKGLTANSSDLILFEKDYDDGYAKSAGKLEYILKSPNVSETMISKNGKKIYTIDEDHNLYVQEGSKEANKIASDVDWATMSPSGNTVAFMKDTDSYYGTGALYVAWDNKEPEKVSSEGCLTGSVSISIDGKYIAFAEIDEDGEDAKTYLSKVGSEKTRVGKHISVGVDNKGTILAVNMDGDLYRIKKGKEAEKITSEPSSIVANEDFSHLLILDPSGTLYSYKGNDKEKVEGNVDSILGVKGIETNKEGNLMCTDTKELDVLLSKNGSAYMMLDGKESEKVTGSSTTDYKVSEDYRQVVYLNNSTLHLKKFKNNKLKVEQEIDSGVSQLAVSRDGSQIAYIKEGDLYFLGSNQKTGTKVEAKDDVSEVQILNNGTMYYETRDDRFFATKGKKAGNKIADDVYDWTVTDKAAYVIDFDDRLFEVTGTNKVTKIADDVSDIQNPSNYLKYSTNLY